MHLPAINACLNATATVLLVAGWTAIRRGNRALHARIMVTASLVSAAFLAGYLYYHFVVVPEIKHTEFNGEGLARVGYFVLLISHVVLAAVNLPMVLRTLWLAHRGRLEAHRRLARWTLPIWLYVSVTGVLVYFVLYRWNPGSPPMELH